MNRNRMVVLACAALMVGCENPAPSWYGSAGAPARAATGGAGSGQSATTSMSSTVEPAAASSSPPPASAEPPPASATPPTSGGAGAAAPPAANGGNAGSAGATGGSSGRSDPVSAGRAGTSAGAGSEATSGGTQSPPPGRTAEGFVNLAPALGSPLDGKGKPLSPPAPDGWTWYEIEGAVCRDGSPTGFYVHEGSANKLLIYLEGGGMCSNASFCSFNPASVNQVLSGDGQTVIGTAFGAIEGRQQPGVYTQADHAGKPRGIFDFGESRNPVRDWSQIYVPYCTGDVHFGTRKNGSVPGLSNQQFVGYLNMKLFISRIVPTFKDRVSYVLLTGANAGGFGAALNVSMVQDAFGDIPVDALSDSGAPMDDKFMPVCMQKRWREAWGFDGSLPPDCETCKQPDGGGLLKLAEYLIDKHPRLRIGMISSVEDEVIRLAYSVGANDCANSDTANPIALSVAQLIDPKILMPASEFTGGLTALRDSYADTGRLATYFRGGPTPNFTQFVFRPNFTETVNGTTVAQFMADFIAGQVQQVGP